MNRKFSKRFSRTCAGAARQIFSHFIRRMAAGVVQSRPQFLNRMGLVPGVPDVVIIKDGHTYALELKADAGRLTEIQRETIEAMQAAGATCAVACGIDAALAQLAEWGLLRERDVTRKSDAIGRLAGALIARPPYLGMGINRRYGIFAGRGLNAACASLVTTNCRLSSLCPIRDKSACAATRMRFSASLPAVGSAAPRLRSATTLSSLSTFCNRQCCEPSNFGFLYQHIVPPSSVSGNNGRGASCPE